jgi:hypothetical protein
MNLQGSLRTRCSLCQGRGYCEEDTSVYFAEKQGIPVSLKGKEKNVSHISSASCDAGEPLERSPFVEQDKRQQRVNMGQSLQQSAINQDTIQQNTVITNNQI